MSAITGLFGGNQQKQMSNSQGNLNNIFNFGLPAGEAGVNAGKSAEAGASGTAGAAGDYWKSILTGGRQSTLNAVAPAVNTAVGQGDAAKREEANTGTGRGGGTNAFNQQRQTQVQSQVDNAVAAAKPAAAQGATQTAAVENAIGSTQLSNASDLLSLSAKSTATSADIAATQLKTAEEEGASTGESLASLFFGG